ncbi:MAG: cytochrome c oxidase accessory protein CcoG [Planctomycetes bacterium]|nr:cytochrome c oxidase accessory protein CcoG [Planctomycetota bacterium]
MSPGAQFVKAEAKPAEHRVLATLNADGSRRWLDPRTSKGRFHTARGVTAWVLIALYAILPFITINGAPAIQIDLANRKFHLFGLTLLSTDTVLMVVLALAIGFLIFLVTALFGRVWCGWACPQTVYMEFVYRPIEKLFRDKQGRTTGWRFAAKYALYFLVSLHLSNVFLSYFVGTEAVRRWTLGSPFDHPAAFMLVMVVTGLMLFDFLFFREQTCFVACPYGRIQAALLDRHSLIVTYDQRRGEPRRPLRTNPGDISLKQAPLGDCVNCLKCVTTCPTGIDIREGLQMECIGCAQCIDACDAVMTKLSKPVGLIRYSSQAMIAGEAKSLFRARTLIYPVLFVAAVTVFVTLLLTRSPLDVDLLPRQGAPFYAVGTGEIANQMRLSVANRSEAARTYTVTVKGVGGARVLMDAPDFSLAPTESRIVGFAISLPREALGARGQADVLVSVTDDRGASRTVRYHMLGPVHRSNAGETPKGATP